jgi:hypothetical protein
MEKSQTNNLICRLLLVDCKIIDAKFDPFNLISFLDNQTEFLITELFEDSSSTRILKWLPFVMFDVGASSLRGVNLKNHINFSGEIELVGRSIRVNENRGIELTFYKN